MRLSFAEERSDLFLNLANIPCLLILFLFETKKNIRVILVKVIMHKGSNFKVVNKIGKKILFAEYPSRCQIFKFLLYASLDLQKSLPQFSFPYQELSRYKVVENQNDLRMTLKTLQSKVHIKHLPRGPNYGPFHCEPAVLEIQDCRKSERLEMNQMISECS